MKIKSITLIIALIVGNIFYGQENTKTKPVPDGMTATKVIDEYIKAIGGQKKVDAIKSILMVYDMQIMGQSFEMTRKVASPNKEYVLVKQGDMVFQEQAFDGEKGYNIIQQNRTEVKGKQLKFAKSKTLPFEDLAYKAGTLDRIEMIDNKEHYVIVFGQLEIYYNAESHLKTQVVSINKNETTEIKSPTNFSDYKEVQGVLIPHKFHSVSGPLTMDYSIKSIKINEGVKDEDFE